MSAEFCITRRVQFAEVDLAGVLHFANYFRMMEEVEHAFWRSLGISVLLPGSQRRLSWPRVAVHCEYVAPACFEDELELRLKVARIGERSLEFEIRFLRGDQHLATGRFTTVCCELGGGSFRAIAIPPEIRQMLAGDGGSASG